MVNLHKETWFSMEIKLLFELELKWSKITRWT